jgi:hypothetical protein
MRQISAARRRVVVLAGSLAAMSGTGPLLLRRHPLAGWIWLGLMVTLLVRVIVLMVRLRKDEGCQTSFVPGKESGRSKPQG